MSGIYLDKEYVSAGDGAWEGWLSINIPSGSWNYPASNPAPLDTDTGVNGRIKRQRFDDTTEEFVLQQIQVPKSIDTTRNVYFIALGYAVTADGNEIQLRFSHDEADVDETWDGAFITEDSGDYSTNANQDFLDEIIWHETWENLGWAAEDHLRIKVSRIAIDDGIDLSGDWGLTHFKIRFPVA